MASSIPPSVGSPWIKTRWLVFGLISALVVALLALMGWALANKEPVTGRSGANLLQRPAPAFNVRRFGGGDVSLAEFRGRPVVLNFWASWCAPCRDEALALERAWQGNAERVSFVGMVIQDADEDALAHIREFEVSYPNGRDDDGSVTVQYGVIGLPVTFFIDSVGTVQQRWVGAITDSQLSLWVNELVGGLSLTDGSGNAEGFRTLDQGP